MTMPYNPVTCLHFHYTDHNGDLAVAQPIVLAWFGKDIPPSTHPLATVANAIVCPAVLEESEHTLLKMGCYSSTKKCYFLHLLSKMSVKYLSILRRECQK